MGYRLIFNKMKLTVNILVIFLLLVSPVLADGHFGHHHNFISGPEEMTSSTGKDISPLSSLNQCNSLFQLSKSLLHFIRIGSDLFEPVLRFSPNEPNSPRVKSQLFAGESRAPPVS